MKVDLVPIEKIRPYFRNPRRNEAAVAKVAASIKEFGFRQPIVVDADIVVVAGHTRLLAAKELGLKAVPVHVARELTPEQIQAYRIADNRVAEDSEWHDEFLKLELGDLEAKGFDTSLTGFDLQEVNQILARELWPGLTDPDEVPESPPEPTTRQGDLWIFGDEKAGHRLLCGDSAAAVDVDRLVDGAKIHLLNTDPPYNVKVEPRSNNAIAAGLSSFTSDKKMHHQKLDLSRHPEKSRPTTRKMRAKDRPLANDFVGDAKFRKLLLAWFWNAARVMLPGRSFYVWGGYSNCVNIPLALQTVGLYPAQAIIWVKEHPVLTRKDFMGNHEWCFTGWREGGPHVFFGPKNVTDVWSVKKVNPQDMIHLTEKPVELAVRAMQYSTRAKENVLDLFGGSGSTLIAAEQTGRRAFLMEIDALYADVIVNRWEAFTGKKAKLVRGAGAPAKAGRRAEAVGEA